MKIKKYGNGPTTVIFLHGGPSLFGYLEELGQALQEYCTVVEYAQRGTIEHPVEESLLSIESHLEDLNQVVESCLSESPPVLLGHSWGAGLALLYEAKFPTRIRKIVLMGTAPLDEVIGDSFSEEIQNRLNPQEKERLSRLQKDYDLSVTLEEKRRIKDETLEVITPVYNYDRESVKQLSRAYWDYDSFRVSIASLWKLIDAGKIPDLLKQIQVPVVSFHGEFDPIPYEPTYDFLRKNLKNFSHKSYPKAGHFIWVEPAVRDRFLDDVIDAIVSYE